MVLVCHTPLRGRNGSRSSTTARTAPWARDMLAATKMWSEGRDGAADALACRSPTLTVRD